jgi:three-Cys-motif partner protein
MRQAQPFGGDWTQDKLTRLRNYLEAYMQIFKKRSEAHTVYVDAFAGTGAIQPKGTDSNHSSSESQDTDDQLTLTMEELESSNFSYFEKLEDGDQQSILEGSPRVALSIEPSFGSFLFIEKDPHKARMLKTLRQEFPEKANRIQIEQADANDYLIRWIGEQNWKKTSSVMKQTRSVMFLDPFGMQVEWKLLETIAGTKGIDLWLLVPIRMGVNRLMPQHNLPSTAWEERLTRFLGTDEWKERFYRTPSQIHLFEEDVSLEKTVNYRGLVQYFLERLRSIFGEKGVAPRPLTLFNSRNVPLYMLCFVSSNQTGVRIADYLLTHKAKRKRGG